jgi:hypothetical protein
MVSTSGTGTVYPPGAPKFIPRTGTVYPPGAPELIRRTGTVYPPEAPEFIPSFSEDLVDQFVVFYVIF